MKISVIGLGKLGLPLAALLAKKGHEVHGYDLSSELRESLRNRSFRSVEPGLNELLEDNEIFIHESIREAVVESQAIFVIVPTPSLPSGHFSNEFILKAVEEIGGTTGKNQEVVIDIVSTVMPGSCSGIIRETLEKSSGRKLNENFGLCYNPEFIALGSVLKDMQYPDMHLIGQSSKHAGDIIEEVLSSVVARPVPVSRMNLTEAELVKIAVNNFVTMKISFANMLLQATSHLESVDIDVVTSALGLDSRIGSKYLKASTPYGGPCFPRDTRALAAFYEEIGLESSLSLATDKVNRLHLNYIINDVISRMSYKRNIGIVGLSYKAGSLVVDESPGFLIVRELLAHGYQVFGWDEEGTQIAKLLDNNNYRTSETFSDLVGSVDLVVITRPVKDLNTILQVIRKGKVEYIDLWREFGENH
jgi:UDPglucose 6-dehydrogenase